MSNSKEKALKNCVLTCATIIDKETYMFIAQGRNPDEETRKALWGNKAPPSKIIVYNTAKDTWGWLEFENGGFAGGNGGAVAGGYIKGHKRAIAVNHMRQVAYFHFAEGTNKSEKNIDVIYAFDRPRLIGDHFYVAGDNRSIAKRLGDSKWVSYTPDPDRATKEEEGEPEFDFDSIDGFSETDIYVCGDEYNLWHFDSNNWTQQKIDVAWSMRYLVCGEDGYVYIGGNDGELLKGNKKEGWTEIVPSDSSPSIGDINFVAQYKNIVYAMTDSYLWELDEKNRCWKAVIFEGETIPNNFGYLSVNAGLMMVAGPYEAAVWDGTTWTFLIGEGVNAKELVATQALFNDIEEIMELRDRLYLLDDD